MHSECADGRRLGRLREDLELVAAPLPLDGPLGRALLEEIHAARWPRPHEGRIPTFGSVILVDRVDGVPELADTEIVPVDPEHAEQARRFADGRRTFLVRDVERIHAVACLSEAAADVARLTRFVQATGGLAVRRATAGTVDVITPTVGLIWDGVRWLARPHAASLAELLRPSLGEADRRVLQGLLELCVQWLGPEGIGATVVWDRSDRGVHRHVEAAEPVPGFTVTCTAHFPALRSAISQTDGAVLVRADGRVVGDGATLLPTPAAQARILPGGGTRHTSAHRYSADVPDAVVLVVSEASPVSVYVAGEQLDVSVEAGACGAQSKGDPVGGGIPGPGRPRDGAHGADRARARRG